MHQHTPYARAGAPLALVCALVFPVGCGSVGSGSGQQPGADGGSGDGGPPAAETCTTQSGTRLRQVTREAADGAQEHLYFQDSELETPCSFAQAADGSIRCLPQTGGRFRRADARYTDAECTDLVAAIDKEQPAGDLLEVVSSSSCYRPTSAYHEMGAVAGITDGEQIFQVLPDLGCRPASADTTRFEYRRVGHAIPVERFVEASQTLLGDGRLKVPRLDGADGSSECGPGRPLRDDERGVACEPAVAEDGVRRCLPLGNQPIPDYYFSDTECAAPIDVASLNPTCEPDTTAIREFVDTECGSVQRMRTIGAPLGQLFWNGTGECGPTPDDGTEFYRIGAVERADEFAALEVAESPVGDRLIRLDLTADGVRVPSGWWRDPMMGADCRFATASDGATRCLPTPTLEAPQAIVSVLSDLAYTDADCTTPIVVAILSSEDACGGAAPTYAVNFAGYLDSVPQGTVFQLGNVITDPVYRKAGTCARYSSEVSLYGVGPVVPPESFVAAFD